MWLVLKLTGAEATANHLLDEGPNFDTLHLVTHGFFTDPSVKSISQAESIPSQTDGPEVNANQFIDTWDAGLLSGLVMAGVNQKKASEGRNEGILLASEIETASLSDVDLVVLSACESGLGAVAGGEGLSGLQRSFQLAGARTVIASLWKVDDLATRELMHRFYFNYWIRHSRSLTHFVTHNSTCSGILRQLAEAREVLEAIKNASNRLVYLPQEDLIHATGLPFSYPETGDKLETPLRRHVSAQRKIANHRFRL